MKLLRLLSFFAALIALVALALIAASCGPSFQAVYEGDVRFEHCYAVDETRSATKDEKAECWRDWMKGYTYGQTKDRVEYASTRHYALTMGVEDAPALSDAGAGARSKRMAMALPTNLHSSPPNVAPEVDAGVLATDDAGSSSSDAGRFATPRLLVAPGTDCVETCASTWNGCKKACAPKACDACDGAHRICMVRCFTGPAPPKLLRKTPDNPVP